MACATLYQCFNFLAAHDGVISLTNHPDDPCKKRCTVRAGETVAAIEYDCTEERDLMTTFMTKVCNLLREQLEDD